MQVLEEDDLEVMPPEVPLAVNLRIAAPFDDGDYYAGRIIDFDDTEATILFDDDDVAVVALSTLRRWRSASVHASSFAAPALPSSLSRSPATTPFYGPPSSLLSLA